MQTSSHLRLQMRPQTAGRGFSFLISSSAVRGTRGLAGRGALGRHVLAVRAVLGVPMLGRPLDVVGQLLVLVDDGGLGAELLAHLDGVVGAVVGALAAGHALVLLDLGHVVAGGGGGGVVVLADAQGQAALGHAVADGEGLALVQGGDLVDTAALLALGHQRLGLGHGAGLALAGAVEHVAHVAHEDAETLVQVAAALAHHAADAATLTRRDAQMALVVLQVLADALVVDLLGVGGDGALHGDDAHDTRAHGGVGGVLDLAGGGVLMEGVGDLGVRLAELLIDQQELKNAGSIGRQEIDLQVDLGHHDLHHETDVGDLAQDLAGTLDGHLGLACHNGHQRRLHAGQGHHDGDLLIGDPLLKDLVLRAVGGDLVVAVVDLLTQLDQILSDFQMVSLLDVKKQLLMTGVGCQFFKFQFIRLGRECQRKLLKKPGFCTFAPGLSKPSPCQRRAFLL